MRILFIGDVVGRWGTAFLSQKLPALRRMWEPELTIVNGENAAEGNGILPATAAEIFSAGASVITLGNHALRRREIFDYLAQEEAIVRPANFRPEAPGRGWYTYDKPGLPPVTVVNLCGAVYMDCAWEEPFSALDSYLKSQLELELMETLDQFPGTVLWVSHDRGEVFRSCQRVCIIDGGQSQPVQDLSQLFHAPGTEAAARLSGCKNFADALPQGDEVYLPAWDLTLRCGRPVPPDTVRAGVRARFVRPAGGPGENTFPCAVARVVEDVFSTIVILRPEGAEPDAPPLRMELDKMIWRALPDRERITVQIAPRDILLFRH